MMKVSRIGKHNDFFWVCIVVTSLLVSGCSHFTDDIRSKPTFAGASEFNINGDYQRALEKYEEIVEKYPTRGDLALFEMGIIYSHPKNEGKDLNKSLECFQKIINRYPTSSYRQDSEMMMFYINNVGVKDTVMESQKARIDILQQEVKSKGSEITALQDWIKSLEQKLVGYAIKNRSVDKILIDKKERRLTVLSKGEVLKTYKVALGGDPVGPKERHDDNKTPEGTYVIDSRNRNSRYHLALHISYPNERDKRRARQLGVAPGGDIMIHGIKNGFSWVGEFHTQVDWTKGCIAVTDEEIEELDKLVSVGTVVEIRP
jgi:L,D-peptidoglycan transpeptidase YkuD (ErfK/YbiS/YcfS/YnhG family)